LLGTTETGEVALSCLGGLPVFAQDLLIDFRRAGPVALFLQLLGLAA
jgi:hypothetical protein